MLCCSFTTNSSVCDQVAVDHEQICSLSKVGDHSNVVNEIIFYETIKIMYVNIWSQLHGNTFFMC